MDLKILSYLVSSAGVTEDEIVALGHVPFTGEQLLVFAAALVNQCAQVQASRSTFRHGYDKHEDAEAIRRHFGMLPVAVEGTVSKAILEPCAGFFI